MALTNLTRPNPDINDSEPGYYQRRGSFANGGIVVSDTTILYHIDDNWYQYVGSTPKPFDVPAGTVPDSNWRNVGKGLRPDKILDRISSSNVTTKPGIFMRTLESRNLDRLTVEDFGAIGDGTLHPLSEKFSSVADAKVYYPFVTTLSESIDWTAINSMFLNTGTVILQAKTYIVNMNLSFANSSIIIRGEGRNKSKIVMSLSQVVGIYFKPTFADYTFEMRDFSLIKDGVPVTGEWGIHIDGSAQLTTNMYNGKKLTSDREKRRGYIHNVGILGIDGANSGWQNGFRLTSLLNFSVTSCSFIGKPSTFLGECISIDGDGVPANIRIHDMYICNGSKGLNLPDYVESIYVSEIEFVDVTNPIVGKYQSGRSTLSESLCGSSGLRILQIYGNSKGTSIQLVNSPFVVVDKSNIVIEAVTGSTDITAVDINNAPLSSITDNNITCYTSDLATAVHGIILRNSANTSLLNNKGKGTDDIVSLVSSTSCEVDNNSSLSLNGRSTVSVVGDSKSTGNRIGRNWGGTVTMASANYFTPIDFSSSFTTNLAALVSQDITITIPANIFSKVPTCVLCSQTSGSNVVVSYLPSTSSSTVIALRMISTTGSAITAGAYSFVLKASYSENGALGTV